MEKSFSFETPALLHAIFDNVIDGIIVIDRKGIVRSMNPAAAKLFLYDPEEVIGGTINNLMPEGFARMHDTYLQNYLDTGEKKIIGIGRDVVGLKKNGVEFPFYLSVAQIKVNGDIHFCGVVHDLTEIQESRRKIENHAREQEKEIEKRTKELASANKKLEKINLELKKAQTDTLIALEKEMQLNELKTRFVTTASHEFRTPLSTILSSISLISRYNTGESSEKAQKHISRIKSAVNNLTHILTDFLNYERLQEGKIPFELSEFNIKVLSNEAINNMQSILKPGQEIIFDSSELLSEEVLLDKQIIRNMTLNLLSNASKYSKEDKFIYFTIKSNEKTLTLSIRDEGIGIPQREQTNIFTRFFRAKNAENTQGTGLGLNIVKKYVEILNGEIKFKSEENVGTEFIIKLPTSTSN
ncbi:MAG: PAS domain-containing sensor histidine kinase [Cyclobacteriaceae bacterium]